MMPWMASAAMALSSVSVVLSSLLLRYFKKPNMRKYDRDVRYRHWLENKSTGIAVHRGIDDASAHRPKTTSILSGIRNSRLSQIVSQSIVAVKHAVMDEKQRATVFLNDERLLGPTTETGIELEMRSL